MADSAGPLRYPVPGNRLPLRSEHLHELALLAIRQSALAAKAGAWGLFLPAGRDPGTCNRVTLTDKEIVVEDLSVLTKGGVAICAPRLQLSIDDSESVEKILLATWSLPPTAKSENEPAPLEIGLSIGQAGDEAHATEELGRITAAAGRRVRRQYLPTAPLITLGATPEAAQLVVKVSQSLERLAALLEKSVRASPFERLSLRARVLACRPSPISGSPTAVLARVSGGVLMVLAMMRAFGTETEAQVALQLEVAVAPPAGDSAERLLRWMEKLCELLAETGPVVGWLRNVQQVLRPLEGFPIAVGGVLREFRYAVPEDAESPLHLGFDSTLTLPPTVWIRLGGAGFKPLELESSANGFTAPIEIDANTATLAVRVPLGVDPVVTVTEIASK
jgi:hypothetical protein